MSNSDHTSGDAQRDVTLPPESDPADANQDDIDYGGQSILGDYVLLEEIGVGGMGQVFKAQHQRMDRIVALKILSSAMIHNPDSVKRFYREVKAAAKLFHPHVVTAFDAGEQQNTHYLVMEYVDGQTLQRLVDTEGPLDLARAVDYTIQAARGLDYAHGLDVVHRDIKPSNLMVGADGIVKILDMGLARFKEEAGGGTAEARLTQAGSIMGTVAYLAPEQATNASEADHRADIYSLGCTLHFLLIGRPVYEGDIVAMVLAHASKPIPSLNESRADVPAKLEAVFERMLTKDPANRYQTMAELVADLETCLLDCPADVSSAPAKLSRPAASAPPETKSSGPAGALADTEITAEPAAGIKLGTFTSKLAHLHETDGPRIVPNAEGDSSTPSLVLIDRGVPGIGDETRAGLATAGISLEEGAGILIGKAVLDAAPEKQKQTAYFFKRALGRKSRYQRGEGCEYPPEVFAAAVLRKMVDDGGSRINAIRRAVLTVPGCFDDVQRKSLQDAALIAGVQPQRLLNETTAAALAWAYRGQLIGDRAAAADPVKVLIYSLGGDCFDTSLIEIETGRARVLSTNGDPSLGARDWTSRLLDSVASGFLREHKMDPRRDPLAGLALWRKCEGVLRALSDEERVELVYRHQEKVLRTHISRDAFRRGSSDLLRTTRALVQSVLREAKQTWDDVDHVLLVGGGKMPMVRDMLGALAKRSIGTTALDSSALAHGAAILAGNLCGTPSLRDFSVEDVNPRGLRLLGVDRKTGKRKAGVLIPRNARLPATRQRDFKTQKAAQRTLQLHLLHGESEVPEECTSIGKLNITDLPADLPAGSPVGVEFRVNLDGRLELSVSSGRPAFTRSFGLSQEHIQLWNSWLDTTLLCSL